MLNMMGKKYINDKEASARYGYSQQWFRLCRHKKIGPPFFKLQGKGKVYYSVEETDEWFRKNMNVV